MTIEEPAGTPNKFIVLRQEMLFDSSLSATEKIVCARICAFDEYFESAETCASNLGLTKRQVEEAKRKLEKAGYIMCIANTGRGKRYKARYDLQKNVGQTYKKLYVRPTKNCNSDLQKNVDIEESIEERLEYKDTKVSLGESKLPPANYGREDINQMFDEWEEAFSYRPKDTKANRYAVSNMLRNKQIGYQKLSGIIKALPKLQERRFCIGKIKGVSDFVSLQREWDAVWAMALREYNKQQHKFKLEDLKI